MMTPTLDEMASALRSIVANAPYSGPLWLWAGEIVTARALLGRYDAAAKATSPVLNEGTPAGKEITRLRQENAELREALGECRNILAIVTRPREHDEKSTQVVSLWAGCVGAEARARALLDRLKETNNV